MSNIDIYKEKLSKSGISFELNEVVGLYEWRLFSEAHNELLIIKTKILSNLKDKTFSYVNSHYYKDKSLVMPYRSDKNRLNSKEEALHYAINELFFNADEETNIKSWVKNELF